MFLLLQVVDVLTRNLGVVLITLLLLKDQKILVVVANILNINVVLIISHQL